jgi:hypothetical protein
MARGEGSWPSVLDEDRRAFARFRFDLEFSADQAGALAHAKQTHTAPGYAAVASIEADAVVLDDQDDDVIAALEHHVDSAGVRVLGDVGERFLRDAVEGDLGFVW